MTENHKSSKVGRVNVLLRRHEDVLEILDLQFHPYGFIYNLNSPSSYFEETLRDEYISLDLYKEILEAKFPDIQNEQLFEISGEVLHESWKSWTDCGYEYDAREWIEDEKVMEFTDEYDIKWIREEYLKEEELNEG